MLFILSYLLSGSDMCHKFYSLQ